MSRYMAEAEMIEVLQGAGPGFRRLNRDVFIEPAPEPQAVEPTLAPRRIRRAARADVTESRGFTREQWKRLAMLLAGVAAFCAFGLAILAPWLGLVFALTVGLLAARALWPDRR